LAILQFFWGRINVSSKRKKKCFTVSVLISQIIIVAFRGRHRKNRRKKVCSTPIRVSKLQKKMFNQDEGKIECAVGNREICVWQSKKAEIVLILFLTSGFAAFICLWLLVLPNSNNLINHVLYQNSFIVFLC